MYRTVKSSDMKLSRRRSLDSLTNLQGLSLALPKLSRMSRRSSSVDEENIPDTLPVSPIASVFSPSSFGSEVKKKIKNRLQKSSEKYVLVIAELSDGSFNAVSKYKQPVCKGQGGMPSVVFWCLNQYITATCQ